MPSIQEMADMFEESLQQQGNEVFAARPVTVRLHPVDVAFAQAVGAHYGVSRSSFLQDLIENALKEFFASLPAESREVISEAADRLYCEEMQQAVAATGGEFFSVGLSKWQGIAKILKEQAA